MRARRAEAGKVDGLAALQLRADRCEALHGTAGIELVKSGKPQQARAEPSGDAESGRAEAGMLGTDSLLRHFAGWAGCHVRCRSINHNWRPATTPVPRCRRSRA